MEQTDLTVLIEITDDLITKIQNLEREIDILGAEIKKMAPEDKAEKIKVYNILDHIDEIANQLWDIKCNANDIKVEAT